MEQWLHFFVGFGTCLADPLLPSESQAAQIPGSLLPACWHPGSWGWGRLLNGTDTRFSELSALSWPSVLQLRSGALVASSVSPFHPTSRGTLCCKLSDFLITADVGLGFLGSALSINPLLSGFHAVVAVLS